MATANFGLKKRQKKKIKLRFRKELRSPNGIKRKKKIEKLDEKSLENK